MPPDHRSAVAALRREKMRARLTEAALQVVAATGLDAAMIDDIVRAAGVSRGSFYNHFFSLQERLLAASHEPAAESVGFLLAEIAQICDPAEKVARGLSLSLLMAQTHPLPARFSAGMGFAGLTEGSVAEAVLPPLLAHGMAEGRFCAMPLLEARDMVAATLLAGLARIAQSEPLDRAAVVAALMRALGIEPTGAETLAALPVSLPAIPPGSLVARTASAP